MGASRYNLEMIFGGLMRKMATIQRIAEVKAIPKADKICAYRVGGWWVVDSVGKYAVDDLAVFCEVDSWMPHSLAPFLCKNELVRQFNGVLGERLRSIKLRGQLSQGLLLPVSCIEQDGVDGQEFPFIEGSDVSEILNIQKWEAPIPAQLAGQVKGSFPSFIRKTDQERIQNLTEELARWSTSGEDWDLCTWEITEKLDGSSMTVFVNRDESGVCSRNLNLIEDQNNSFWKVTRREKLLDKILSTNRNYAFQGELIGEGIQGNPYGITGQEFFLYDIFDIDAQEYIRPLERHMLCEFLDIKHVPIIDTFFVTTANVDAILEKADGVSKLNDKTNREGLVFKCNDSGDSFKAISNKFLLNGGE